MADRLASRFGKVSAKKDSSNDAAFSLQNDSLVILDSHYWTIPKLPVVLKSRDVTIQPLPPHAVFQDSDHGCHLTGVRAAHMDTTDLNGSGLF